VATPAQNRATIKYNRERVDRITVKPDKDTGARIRAAAQAAGQPLQRWIIEKLLAAIQDDDKRI
jgi:hypothetical protein